MTLTELITGIDVYIQMYQAGLKKKANQLLEMQVRLFEKKGSGEQKDADYTELLRMICDTEKGKALIERGNGRLPHALYCLFRDYLLSACAERRMPHLRWFYQLFKTDKDYHDAAVDALEKAFHHKQCCLKTAGLYLKTAMDLLAFGAHHFPDGCCIEREEYERAIARYKEAIIRYEELNVHGSVVSYYKTLYAVWEKYCASGKTADFCAMCAREGISFPVKLPPY